MAKANSTYVPAKVVEKAVFHNGDATLTVMLTEGKSGYNTKASLKAAKGKGAPKAQTGCRGTFQTEKDGKMAFEKLVKESEKAGWTIGGGSSRNAFNEIPKPSEMKLGSKAHNHK